MASDRYHVCAQLSELRGGQRLEFVQNFVVRGADMDAAKERLTELLARDGLLIVTFVEDACFEVTGEVTYVLKRLDDGIEGMSGRIYILPERPLWKRLWDTLRGAARTGD